MGGVTTTLTHCCFALNPLRHPSVAPASVSVPVSVPRDVSTVLEFQPCPVHVPIPDPSVVQPLSVRVLPLGLHGGGLLGPRPILETTVVTPARGARKGNWGIRPLSLKELLQIYDVGDKFLPLLLQEPPDLRQFTPLHSSAAAITAALSHTGGGSFFAQIQEVPVTSTWQTQCQIQVPEKI